MTSRGLGRPFVVTDGNLARAGVVGAITEALRDSALPFGVFEGGQPEPTIDTALAATAAADAFKPDCILGLGGGSNMDLAKIVATLLAHGGKPADYFGFNRIPGPILPLVCVPTTSGTGSEVSHCAVLTDSAAQMKVSTLSPHMRPALAVVDPLLTLSCPAKATADSGIDALTHAIEAATAVDFASLEVPDGEPTPYDGRTPMGDLLAERAIRLVGRHLEAAVREPSNLAAREGMSLAATLAGLAFSNCAVAAVHALEYPLGGALHVSHGAGNGLLLPYVMRFNLPARVPAFASIGRWLGVVPDGLSEPEAAEAAIREVERLKRAIGIPERLRDIGARADQLPGFAAKSHAITRLMLLNPRRPSESDLLAILQSAL